MPKRKNKIVQLPLIDIQNKKGNTDDVDQPQNGTANCHTITIRVKLLHNKRVNRDILIGSRHTLDDLHNAVFASFDRDEEHLYTFFFPQKATKNKQVIKSSPEIGCKELYDEPFQIKTIGNAKKVQMSELDLFPKQKFFYLFDFGDEWWHEIEVISIDASEPSPRSPIVIRTAGKSPSQYS